MGSTLVVDDAPMARYPMDDFRLATSSMKVAASFSLPSAPGVTTSYHGRQIPVGYARIGVDEVMKG